MSWITYKSWEKGFQYTSISHKVIYLGLNRKTFHRNKIAIVVCRALYLSKNVNFL